MTRTIDLTNAQHDPTLRLPAELPAGWPARDLRSLINGLSRRGFITGATAASLLGRVARISAQASPVAGQWPRTVTGSLGDVTIPTQPTSILALSDWGEVDYLVAMGVEPAIYGYTNRYGMGVSPWLAAAGGEDLPRYDLVLADGPDLEIVASANPDLIIAEPNFAQDILEQLSAIAPTLGVPTTFTGSTWRDAQTVLGQACGTEADAQAAIDRVDSVIAAGKAALANLAGRTVTVAYFSASDGESSYTVIPAQGAALIPELGLAYNGYDSESSFDARSMETVSQLTDADILIVIDFGLSDAPFDDNPLVQFLPVIAESRYTVLDVVATRAFWGQTTLSVEWVVPHLVDAILEAAGPGARHAAGGSDLLPRPGIATDDWSIEHVSQ